MEKGRNLLLLLQRRVYNSRTYGERERGKEQSGKSQTASERREEVEMGQWRKRRRWREGRTDAEVHANSTFDEMRAREIKVERAPSTTCVGRISGSARPNGRPTDRRRQTDGLTDAFATHFSTFPGIGVSGRRAGGQRRAEQGERIPA